MRRIGFLSAFVAVFILVNVACAESNYNLSEMSMEELVSLENAIQAEIANRQSGQSGEYDPSMVEIEEEYQMDINGSAFYFIVIKNITDYDLELRLEADAIGSDDEILDSTKEWEHAVSPGAEIILIPRFVHLPLENVSTFKYRLESKKAEYYFGVNYQMDVTYEKTDNGIMVKMTNTGTTPVKYPMVYTLFFRDGEFIDFGGSTMFYGNGVNTLEPGVTEEKEVRCNKIFDTVKIFTGGEWE